MEQNNRIRAFIEANMAAIDEEITLNDSDNIFENGFVDSMFAMQLVAFIENEFAIQLSNEDLDLRNFNSVENVVKFLDNKKNS